MEKTIEQVPEVEKKQKRSTFFHNKIQYVDKIKRTSRNQITNVQKRLSFAPIRLIFRSKPRAGLLFFIETTKKQIKRRNTHD